ncbi:hypothetical protein E3N88_12826 [Mikania micrantha]|uniref:Uncharacterized protein n=1 Tax=Mikania micrantha TaxID=192012 RepID=A0A5N6P960_9ASTR|nr:hypothetical protein E3N88_12826 [Mikania micrantha]
MVKAIRVYELGGPEVMKWEDVEIGDPKEEEIRVKNMAIGMVAVGVVTAIGEGVCELKIGDIVYRNAMGTYTEEQIVFADKEMPLPPIDPLVVASVMIQGLTARFLVHTWLKVRLRCSFA